MLNAYSASLDADASIIEHAAFHQKKGWADLRTEEALEVHSIAQPSNQPHMHHQKSHAEHYWQVSAHLPSLSLTHLSSAVCEEPDEVKG